MKISDYIEYTILKPNTTEDEIIKVCGQAISNDFFAVCVPPYYVCKAKKYLKNTNVKVVSVIGFPLGYNSRKTKIQEIQNSIESGADELDMVMNISAFKNKDYTSINKEISMAAILSHDNEKKFKLIIETAFLNNEEIIKICSICNQIAIVDFVKTSTGFANGGAKIEDIRLMRANLNKNIKIKASGGIKNGDFARKLIEAGADRIGTSSLLI